MKKAAFGLLILDPITVAEVLLGGVDRRVGDQHLHVSLWNMTRAQRDHIKFRLNFGWWFALGPLKWVPWAPNMIHLHALIQERTSRSGLAIGQKNFTQGNRKRVRSAVFLSQKSGWWPALGPLKWASWAPKMINLHVLIQEYTSWSGLAIGRKKKLPGVIEKGSGAPFLCVRSQFDDPHLAQ